MVFRFPLHGMRLLYLQKLVFLFLPRDAGWYLSSATSDVTKTDFHTAFLDASEPAAPFYVRSGWRMAACPVCLKTIKRGNFQEKPCFHKMLISRGVTDGTVVSEVLAAVQETSRRHVFGVRGVAGWTADFDVVSLENTYPYFAEL